MSKYNSERRAKTILPPDFDLPGASNHKSSKRPSVRRSSSSSLLSQVARSLFGLILFVVRPMFNSLVTSLIVLIVGWWFLSSMFSPLANMFGGSDTANWFKTFTEPFLNRSM